MMTERLTKQKQIIKTILMSEQTHLTGDQLFDILQTKGFKIGRATVFRNLKQLVNNNEIGYIPVVDGATYFDFCKHHHYHLKCNKCKQLFDTTIKYQEQLDILPSDFKVDEHFLIFYGLCPQCKQ